MGVTQCFEYSADINPIASYFSTDVFHSKILLYVQLQEMGSVEGLNLMKMDSSCGVCAFLNNWKLQTSKLLSLGTEFMKS